MQIAVKHLLQVYDPSDEAHREADAFVLPVRDAEAVMGETVAAYLKRVEWRFDLPTVCRINGEFYGRAEWETRVLAVNDNIEFISRPLAGGSSSGGSGKSLMGVVALIALTVLAPYAVGAIGAAGATALGTSAATLTFAGKLAAAAIIGAGALVVSHFLKPKAGGKTNASEELYNFGFQGNAARPMQPIPVLNGRLRFAPDYAAPTYSEYSGDSMIDYALFSLTCGRMQVEQILIGDTPIWHYQTGANPDYPGIEIQLVEPGAQVTLYPVNVVTADELQGVELQQNYTPGYIINAAGTKAKELLFDLVWPGGAFVTYKDRMFPATTHVRIEVRQVNDAGAPITGWTVIVDDQYQQAKDSQIRMTVRRTVAPARYEVRARRMNASVDDSGIQKISGTDEVTWTAARAHIEGPQSFPRVTTLAVKGVASKQLSGISGGQLRVIGTRVLPVWRNGQFIEEPTRSIAWAALDWWTNSDYSAGLSLGDVDFQAFVTHDALWSQLGHTFDYRFTEVTTLDDVLETVLKAGRAFPSPVGDKLTITRDQPRVLPRMLFTDNDIITGSFEIDYSLSDETWADGLVGEYVDQTTWRLAEVSSAPDGVKLLKPGRVQLQGAVDRKQAMGMIRFMAAESQYRRITATWTARSEGRLLKRGDLVHVSTEMPETWGRSHEISGFDPEARRLVLDPPPEWTSGTHYLEIRQRDGRPWGPVVVSRGRNDEEVVVSASSAASVAAALGVTLEDAIYRSDTQEPGWAVFSPGQPRSFPILVTEGDPDQDGEHITLTGVIDAPEVYTTTEDGVVPLPQVPDIYSAGLPLILALDARVTQRQATLILTAGWQPAKNAARYEAGVSYDKGASWVPAYDGIRSAFESVVGSAEVGSMRVRVRGITASGDPGGWTVVAVEAPNFIIPGMLIDVVTLPPIDYEGFTDGVKKRFEDLFEGVEGNAAKIIEERDTRIKEDEVIARIANGAAVKADDALAGVEDEREARIQGEQATSEALTTVFARANEGTAAGQFKLVATAGPSGVSARLQALISKQVDGVTYGAGYYIELLDDNRSRFVVDADAFFITSQSTGSSVVTFSYDGATGTLRVPYLVLTSGQASTPLRVDIPSYTLIAGQGTVNDLIDANLNFQYNVTNSDFPSNIEVFGFLTISGPAGTQLLGMRLIVDGALSGFFRFNEQNTFVSVGPSNNTFFFRCSCIRYLPLGIRSVRIQYSYTSPGAGKVQIDELHLAGFQPKA